MVDIQSNILEKLHCSKCNEYLSYAPIMITEDGESLCGRCVTESTDKKLIRNKAYEDFASIAAFPCRYKESGCEVTIPWDDMNIHEDHCEYRTIECPVAQEGTCKWKAPQCTLLNHYEETHPELIIAEHPCSLDSDIVINNDKNMLLSFLGFVFLVQIRCNTSLSKLWHCVHCLTQPKIAGQFNFSVRFSSDEGSFKKEKRVLAEKCLKMQNEKSVETNVNNLLGLLGDCKNIKVVLSILPKVDSDLQNLFLCSKCENSKLPAVFRTNDKYYCARCRHEDSFLHRYMQYLYGKVLKRCKNSDIGCPYNNLNKKLIYRHEMWECKWQKQCIFNCHLSFNELQNHFENKAHPSLFDNWLKLNTWYYGHIRKNDNVFLYKCLMKMTSVEIYIYTQLPVEDISLYKCILKFDRSENLALNCTPTAEHDWEICQNFNKNYYLDKDNEYKIIDIIISKDQ